MPGKPMPPIPTSTSAVKAFKEDGPGVPSPGTECDEYQSVSVLSYELRLRKTRCTDSDGEAPIAR